MRNIVVMMTMMMLSTLKVTSVCSMGDGACDDQDNGDADGDDEDDDGDGEDDGDEDHLEGDICVRHGRLRIKVFEQQFDVCTAFSPVPRTRALHFIINRFFCNCPLFLKQDSCQPKNSRKFQKEEALATPSF